jgi:predicted RNA-binding Zn ribbon-like protein
VGPSAYKNLVRTAERRPKAAAMAHARAIALREATYRTFATLAGNGDPRDRDLSLLHAEYVEALQHARPRITGDGLTWSWSETSLDHPRWRLAADAVNLLRSEQLDRVKSCTPSCGWLFVDSTKNRSRRWCSMRECGFGEKARLQAARRARRRRTG